MCINQRSENAKHLLELTLSFFPRVDAKASVVMSVDTAMLGILGVTAPPIKLLGGEAIVALISVALIAISLFLLYKQLFPLLGDGKESHIYFREIAKKPEQQFIKEFSQLTEEQYVEDLLSQVWRNSEILKKKFDYLQSACILMALAILPWLVALAMFSSKNTELKALLGK